VSVAHYFSTNLAYNNCIGIQKIMHGIGEKYLITQYYFETDNSQRLHIYNRKGQISQEFVCTLDFSTQHIQCSNQNICKNEAVNFIPIIGI
jgi:hypothetical protein